MTHSPVPSVSLDQRGLSPTRRWQDWRDYNAGLFELKPLSDPKSAFSASSQSYRVGHTVLGTHQVTGNIVKRHPQDVQVDCQGLLVARLHRSGYTKGVMNDLSFEMRPDRITIFDFHQSIEAITEDVDYVSFTCRHEDIGYDPGKHPNLLQLEAQSAPAQMLASNLEFLLETVPQASREEAANLSEVMCGLLKGIISRDLQEDTTRQRFGKAREIAVRRFVADNLRDPALDAEMICAAIGVSRPVLYRLFETEGGVNRAIRHQRLQAALEDLMTRPPERGVIARVARHWGFSDQAYFSRVFREKFGYPPGEAVGVLLRGSDQGPLTPGGGNRRAEPGNLPLVGLYGPCHMPRDRAAEQAA